VSLRPQKRNNNCIAVIGDGAITGGMAYEAMNHAGFLDTNMIVVLNDNQQVRVRTAGASDECARASSRGVPVVCWVTSAG